MIEHASQGPQQAIIDIVFRDLDSYDPHFAQIYSSIVGSTIVITKSVSKSALMR